MLGYNFFLKPTTEMLSFQRMQEVGVVQVIDDRMDATSPRAVEEFKPESFCF